MKFEKSFACGALIKLPPPKKKYICLNEAYVINAKPVCHRIKNKYTVVSLSPQRLHRIHYIMQNGHSEPYNITVIESSMPIFLCAWSEVLCYFNELFRLVTGCILAVTTSSMNNCYWLLKAICMEFMQIRSKGRMCLWGYLGIIAFQMSFFYVNHTQTYPCTQTQIHTLKGENRWWLRS